MFEFFADKNRLTMQKKEPVTSGSVNAYRVRFLFSQAWEGLTRTAVFKGGGETRSVLLDEAGECVIPWEVLQKPLGLLEAGVYGACGGKTALPTVWASLGIILPGAVPGEGTRPPTPDAYQQILAQTQASREEAALSAAAASGAADSARAASEAAERRAAQAAALIARMPVIRDGEWWLYDPDQEEYVSAGQPAQGEKGDTGPAGKTGERGKRGETGAVPELTIGAVTTLPAGEPASAAFTGTPERPVLHLSIPEGRAGVVFDACGPSPVAAVDVAAAGTPLQPVSEIRPIRKENAPAAGWNGAELRVSGKNLVDYNEMLDPDHWLLIPSALFYYRLPCKENETYTISIDKDFGLDEIGVDFVLALAAYDGGAFMLKRTLLIVQHATARHEYNPAFTFTAEPGIAYFLRALSITDPTVHSALTDVARTLQLELGGQATAYEPYRGGVYTAAFPETVYGGTYDWARGALTVTHEMAEPGIVSLPEPRTLQLPPQKSFAVSGENIIFSDTGDTAVTFQADLKKYVDKKISEAVKAAVQQERE